MGGGGGGSSFSSSSFRSTLMQIVSFTDSLCILLWSSSLLLYFVTLSCSQLTSRHPLTNG